MILFNKSFKSFQVEIIIDVIMETSTNSLEIFQENFFYY